MGEKDDLSDFVIVFGAKWAGLTISETADLNIRPLFINDFFLPRPLCAVTFRFIV